ncbi:MAG: L,D-transpeptidase family protein [Gammaproteobacteria bacterium]|nr:L,D-transpeptidase family protein [Gammaproteobacteria bacterium]NNC58251.1 L,D-transpeptidase family protein [Woeseiaceae bacterium]
MSRRLALLLPLLVLGGCATLDDFLASIRKGMGSVPFEERPVEEPIAANNFVLASADQSVIGEPQVVFTRDEDTLSDLAREYGLGYDEIVIANPDVDPWLPGGNTPVILPTQYVLPNVPREGVVLNIATKRLFYFPKAGEGEQQQVLTYPIGIGRVGWETPLGSTKVVSKAKDPSWWVPASVRREHAEMGDPLPAIVPPGPDNPLGTRVLKLGMPGYLIHGTNQPYGVGMRVSHGCVRLYPENIELLYALVAVGEPVTIINEPFQIGERDGVIYFEAHAPLKDDAVPADERLQTLLDTQVDASGRPLNEHLKDHVRSLAEKGSGLPISIVMYDADEFTDRARVVQNTVEIDPDAPTLMEVRKMMDEVNEQKDLM